MLKKITLVTVSAVAALAMNSASININNEDLELSANLDIGQFNENVEPETMFFGARYLDADNSDRGNNNPLFEVNFLRQKEIPRTSLSIGLGVKLNYTKDYRTLPLGIDVTYRLPSTTVIPISVHANVYYAPKVLSFDNASKYFENRVECDIELIDNGHIIVGYRNIRTDYDDARGDFIYNESGYVGFKFEF